MGSPEAAYRSGEGSALRVETAFYDRLAEHTEDRELVERFVLPIRSGRAWEVPAEQDLLCALSTCPGGDLSVPLWGPDARDLIDVCRPLGVEVHRPSPALTKGWGVPPTAAYQGRHGPPAPVDKPRRASHG